MIGRKPRSYGLDLPGAADLKNAIATSKSWGYNFVCVPLAHPLLKRCLPKEGTKIELTSWARTDLVMGTNDWQNHVVPKVSSWLNLDSPNENFRKTSETILNQELLFAHHLGIKAVLVEIHGRNNANLARQLFGHLYADSSTYYKEDIWVRIPTTSKKSSASCFRNDLPEDAEDDDDTWHWWNDFRLICDSNRSFKVALELTPDLPSTSQLDRWLGEPVDVLILPTSLFLTNKGGYPALSTAHQRFIQKFASRGTLIMMTGSRRHSSHTHYYQYINYLYLKAELPPHLQSSTGYEEHLQIPLQPLADHLESYTYETFEKDPVKYTEYGNAIQQALIDRVPDEEADTNTQIIMVVGAGRGPLVNQAILAARCSNRKIRVYALDKNPNAIVALLDLKKVDWKDAVTVVHCDMRKWEAPEKCDILVSELLGSFGDNELSPECLDGVQRFLKDDGISIPSSYRSYLQPVMSMRLYNECRELRQPDKPAFLRFEQTYVVAQSNYYWISPAQQVFEFVHPNRSEPIDNSRYKKLNFAVEEDCTLYGFSGYFDTTLYKNVMLSILPKTYSSGMFSWFPLYIPIKEPLSMEKGETIELHFWRKNDEKRVWYEWCVTSPLASGIHNPQGRSSTIGL